MNFKNNSNLTPKTKLELLGKKNTSKESISSQSFLNVKNKKRDSLFQKLKTFIPKINRKTRKEILKNYPPLNKMFYCTSKYQFRNILFELSPKYKKLLREYISKCFIYHLHMRPINDISQLMKQRKLIYEAVSNPELLNGNKSLANNLIKNFCKGIVNFIVLFYDDLVKKGFLPIKNIIIKNESDKSLQTEKRFL